MEDLRSIPALLKVISESPIPSGNVLSVYIDTSPKRVEKEGQLICYKDLAKTIRQELPDSEIAGFNAAASQAERFLMTDVATRHPGFAIFSASQPGYFFVAPLPRRPANTMHWDARPSLDVLRTILDDYERAAIVLFDAHRARLFTVYLGQLEEHLTITDEVPRKQKTGGWAALSQSRYARHREDHLLDHAKHTVSALVSMLRSHPFDRLFIGGPDEPLAILKHQLPKPLRDRLDGTVRLELVASNSKILEAALKAMEDKERRAEVAAIDELFEAPPTDHAALGSDKVLDALHDQRVDTLYLADSFAEIGGECPQCHRLVAGPGPCPACDSETEPVIELSERVTERAIEQGARVEILSGAAAQLLSTRGGLGAWTRY